MLQCTISEKYIFNNGIILLCDSMSETSIYIEFDKDVQRLLADNKLSIADILHQESIEAKVSDGELMPLQGEDGLRNKELVTLIIASSVLIPAISYAISRVIRDLSNRPHFVEWDELEEVRNANGDVVLDEQGKPVFKTVRKHEVLQPRETTEEIRPEIIVKPGNELAMKYSLISRQ